MDSWKTIQSSFGSLGSSISTGKIAKGFSSSVQATRERLGQVAPEEITELPQEYKELERRVDGLRAAVGSIAKITKVYETETYDYPVHIQESLAELSISVGAGLTNFAASNLKGTTLPAPSPTTAPPAQHKTLPHALGRAATQAANQLDEEDKLGKGLGLYAQAYDKIANARVEHDQAIRQQFLHPWQQTLTTSIGVAMKARAAVRTSRLELDAAKAALKSAGPQRQEQARLEVENAEDDLVQKTEVAIGLMKTVLGDPGAIRALGELVRVQMEFFGRAHEALGAVQGDIEELGVAAEGEYRKSRDH